MKKLLLSAVCGIALMASAANAQVYVHVGPPPPVVERVGPSPHPGWAWTGGYHRWDGAHYVWTPGRWALPPHPNAEWVPAHWANRPRGYVLVPGHWRG